MHTARAVTRLLLNLNLVAVSRNSSSFLMVWSPPRLTKYCALRAVSSWHVALADVRLLRFRAGFLVCSFSLLDYSAAAHIVVFAQPLHSSNN